jgi:hypothetical protein
MRMFRATIVALGTAQETERDGFELVDEQVGWPKLLKARSESGNLAELAEEKPLVRAADRYQTLRRFAPVLIEALAFQAAHDNDPIVSALKLLQELNRAGKRDLRPILPCHFARTGRS